jgi:hypothetical protein
VIFYFIFRWVLWLRGGIDVHSVADRVFVHALNTVKRIPRTGTARPPAAERLKLYGLYKQSMGESILWDTFGPAYRRRIGL